MSDVISEKELLLALHRRLYQFNPESQSIYELLEQKSSDLLSLVSDEDRVATEKILKECEKENIRIITWFDEDYPMPDVSYRPPVIYIKGSFPSADKNPYIAIVGSRKPTEYGREMTEKIVRELRPFGAAIVSGLAYGIDAEAHKQAVRHGLPTVAVLGCGINISYPESNRALSQEIAKSGAVVSEFPWGTPPLKHNFPWRNRIISGISKGVIVVEGIKKSGSLITAKWAADQGKTVFAVPGSVGRMMSSGTNHLIKEGAHLIEGGIDVAETLNLKEKKKSGQIQDENGIKLAVQNFLKSGKNNLDELVEETGLSVKELLPLVTEIELSGE